MKGLRFWAVTDAVYAVGVALLVVILIPWKAPAANVGALLYALAVGGPALALYRERRWAAQMAFVTSVAGLAGAIVVVTGLCASWAFLRSIYGVFGAGASVVSLFLAASAFQVLGLYPALRLRALWRPEVRAALRSATGDTAPAHPGRAISPGAIIFFAVLAPPALAAGLVHARFAMPAPLAPLSADARMESFRLARLALSGSRVAGAAAFLSGPSGPGPVYLTLFSGGRAVARGAGRDALISRAVESAARDLAAQPAVRGVDLATARVKFDRTVAVAAVAAKPRFLLAMAIDPGRDGVAVAGEGAAPPALLPDDFIAANVYGIAPLLPFLDEVRLGIDASFIRARFGEAPGQRLQRFRVESVIECERGACVVERGTTLLPTFAPRVAAIAAGDFILRQLRGDGTFNYVVLPYAGDAPSAGYNIARHAGTAYTLALLHHLSGEPRFAAGASRAVDWLIANTANECAPGAVFACVVESDGRTAKVGSNALAVLAAVELLRARPDPAVAAVTNRWAAFLRHMQKPSGDFFHVFDRSQAVPDWRERPQMFASEEAAFALVAAGKLLHQPPLLTAARGALDFLTSKKYDFFLGRFTYGIDSWTCMAANAGWPELRDPRYLEFCLGYADFLARIQFQPGENPAPDFAGHFGFSHVMIPQAPAAAGFAEALAAVFELARQHGRPVPVVKAQIDRALRALARDQLRADNDYLVRDRQAVRGGIRRSLVQSDIRIDFVQHAAAAFAHAARLGFGD